MTGINNCVILQPVTPDRSQLKQVPPWPGEFCERSLQACVHLGFTCVPINVFTISSMRVITYECELNLLTRLLQNFLDPYEV